MRRVYYSFPDDHDVMALFVEALLMRTPRRLWDLKTGLPAAGSDIREALSVCERSIAINTAIGATSIRIPLSFIYTFTLSRCLTNQSAPRFPRTLFRRFVPTRDT